MFQATAAARTAASYHPAAAGAFAPSQIDARADHRARAHWPVRLIGASAAVVSGWVSDVSEGGMGLMSSAHLPVGALLETAVAIPHPQDPRRSLAVRVKVRVVSSSFCGTQSRLGVQFLSLPMEARIAIRRYAISHS